MSDISQVPEPDTRPPMKSPESLCDSCPARADCIRCNKTEENTDKTFLPLAEFPPEKYMPGYQDISGDEILGKTIIIGVIICATVGALIAIIKSYI